MMAAAKSPLSATEGARFIPPPHLQSLAIYFICIELIFEFVTLPNFAPEKMIHWTTYMSFMLQDVLQYKPNEDTYKVYFNVNTKLTIQIKSLRTKITQRNFKAIVAETLLQKHVQVDGYSATNLVITAFATCYSSGSGCWARVSIRSLLTSLSAYACKLLTVLCSRLSFLCILIVVVFTTPPNF